MTALRIAEERPSYLTEREQRVLERIADGQELAVIAREMGYAERTVKNIVHDILTKLNAHNRAHAVALAIAQGWLLTGDRALVLAKHHIDEMERQIAKLEAKLARIRKEVL
jgi:DNA-binding CsgD family transcriptional regulator